MKANLSYRERWLDEAVLRTLGKPFCEAVFRHVERHNQLGVLATMPGTLLLIRREYNRIASGACVEAPSRRIVITPSGPASLAL